MEVLLQTLKQCASDDIRCIKTAFLESGEERKGISGTFRYERDGSIARSFVMKTVRAGELVFLKQ